MMDTPDDPGLKSSQSYRQGTYQVGMIHPGLDDMWLLLMQIATQRQKLARIENAIGHSNDFDRYAGFDQGISHAHVIDQGNDGRFKTLPIRPQQQVDQHRFGTTKIEAVDDVNNPELSLAGYGGR